MHLRKDSRRKERAHRRMKEGEEEELRVKKPEKEGRHVAQNNADIVAASPAQQRSHI